MKYSQSAITTIEMVKDHPFTRNYAQIITIDEAIIVGNQIKVLREVGERLMDFCVLPLVNFSLRDYTQQALQPFIYHLIEAYLHHFQSQINYCYDRKYPCLVQKASSLQ